MKVWSNRCDHEMHSELSNGTLVAGHNKFHTSGGPRRRPCLGECRGPWIFPCIGNNHPNRLVFFSEVETTNQRMLLEMSFIYSIYPSLIQDSHEKLFRFTDEK